MPVRIFAAALFAAIAFVSVACSASQGPANSSPVDSQATSQAPVLVGHEGQHDLSGKLYSSIRLGFAEGNDESGLREVFFHNVEDGALECSLLLDDVSVSDPLPFKSSNPMLGHRAVLDDQQGRSIFGEGLNAFPYEAYAPDMPKLRRPSREQVLTALQENNQLVSWSSTEAWENWEYDLELLGFSWLPMSRSYSFETLATEQESTPPRSQLIRTVNYRCFAFVRLTPKRKPADQ